MLAMAGGRYRQCRACSRPRRWFTSVPSASCFTRGCELPTWSCRRGLSVQSGRGFPRFTAAGWLLSNITIQIIPLRAPRQNHDDRQHNTRPRLKFLAICDLRQQARCQHLALQWHQLRVNAAARGAAGLKGRGRASVFRLVDVMGEGRLIGDIFW